MPSLDLPELARLITSVMPGDQIPWSGIATLSGIYYTPTMTEHIASIVIAAATIMGIGTQVTIHQLDKATAKQCINHEWPVEAHDIHLAWCAANNYPTN
jgi:hypothetical protein